MASRGYQVGIRDQNLVCSDVTFLFPDRHILKVVEVQTVMRSLMLPYRVTLNANWNVQFCSDISTFGLGLQPGFYEPGFYHCSIPLLKICSGRL